MSHLTPEQVRAAVARHETVYFDSDLNPVIDNLVVGRWFCEFYIEPSEEGNEVLVDDMLVEYVGGNRVLPEGDDDDRTPRGDILILQA